MTPNPGARPMLHDPAEDAFAEVERLQGVERRARLARDGMLAAQTAVQLRDLLEWILTGTDSEAARGEALERQRSSRDGGWRRRRVGPWTDEPTQEEA